MKLRQVLTKSAEKLFEISQTISIIDTHEHIPISEKAYNERTLKFGDLFHPYLGNDLFSAGMSFPQGRYPKYYCISDDWDQFEPYWKVVKFGSYARAIRIALQEFYGAEDLTRENYEEIVKRINQNNTSGIYRRIFQDKCHIEKCICCGNDLPDRNDSLLLGNIDTLSMQADQFMPFSPDQLKRIVEEVGAQDVRNLDEFVEVSDRWMELQVEKGAMEFKCKAIPVEIPNKAKAEEELKVVLRGEPLPYHMSYHLMAYLREAYARKAAELNVPIALHAGIWWDYRTLSANDLIGFIRRNPATRMDIYHLGIPEVRNTIQIVKNFPNAYLNLCWAHIVAPEMVVNTLKEALDMIPLNKIFAFGGDYILFIEKIYGHLLMARENISLVLGERVDGGLMDMCEAERILMSWFYENPKKFYQI